MRVCRLPFSASAVCLLPAARTSTFLKNKKRIAGEHLIRAAAAGLIIGAHAAFLRRLFLQVFGHSIAFRPWRIKEGGTKKKIRANNTLGERSIYVRLPTFCALPWTPEHDGDISSAYCALQYIYLRLNRQTGSENDKINGNDGSPPVISSSFFLSFYWTGKRKLAQRAGKSILFHPGFQVDEVVGGRKYRS